MHGIGVSAVSAYTAHREWASPPTRRALPERSRALRCGARAAPPHRRAHHRHRDSQDRGGGLRCARAPRGVGPHRQPDALELRAARRHRQRAAEIPPDVARADRVRCDQLGLHGSDASSISSSSTAPTHGPSTRSPLRGTRGSTTTSWPPGCSTSWPSTRRGTCRSVTRTASSAPSGFRPAPTWETETCFCSSWTATVTSTIPRTRTHAGLFRGFILRNSDVGAAALTLDVFLFRMVCGNHVRHVIGA